MLELWRSLWNLPGAWHSCGLSWAPGPYVHYRLKKIDSPAYTGTVEGPAHTPCFKVRVTVYGHAFESPDFFKSRRAAEHAAVNVALISFPFDGFQEASSLTEFCRMPASVQGGSLSSPPMTQADCSFPSISDSSVGRLTGTRSYLLYNRIRVYPCVPDISFLKDILGIPGYLASPLRARVSSFIQDRRWVLDDCFRAHFPDLSFRIDRILISHAEDSLVWAHSRDGMVSCKAAYSQMFRNSPQRCISANSWGSFFSQAMVVSFSDQVPVLWKVVIHEVVWIFRANRLGIGCMHNCMDDLLILRRFGLHGRPTKTPVIKSMIWLPTALGWIKHNTDGAALSVTSHIVIE
ncbi:hypothetical protein Dsin_022800 [Dipteronia sinensis]|uniref:DRBM domain-containing protein n=1 Tax=Dipteronia sinensis TaxID=43782 RepID=A0AAE0A2M4_9ROSI|nr:hypothetical protein Dsin_022800 [Dipteronia sinensis]